MKRLLCVLSIIALPIIANGDTVRLTNNSSLNGSVRYEDEIFYVQADFRGGTKHYAFPRDEVTADEINNETFNQGAPPPGITAHEIGHEKWVAINTPGDQPARVTEAARKSKNETAIGSPAAAAVGGRGPVIDRGRQSDYLGRDTLTLKNGSEQMGTLRRMTASTIIFRPSGRRNDVEYHRDSARIVTVKKSY